MLMQYLGSMGGEVTSEIKVHSLLGDPMSLSSFGNTWLMHTCIPTHDRLGSNNAQFGANQIRTTSKSYTPKIYF